MKKTLTRSAITALTLSAALFGLPALANPIEILFVGNSYTFGRIEPVLGYNAAKVHDLTATFNAVSCSGTNSCPPPGSPGYDPTKGWFEPHPWGGVPGIFKQLTDEAGLDYDVSLSTRNAATLRGQFLNTANAAWDLRGNVASKTWGVVVLQEQSDAALPDGRGKNANLATFNAYADMFERYVHTGLGTVGTPDGVGNFKYKENQLFGSAAACMATGLSSGSCNLTRTIPINANASAATRVYLQQTWARPDMVEAHLITSPDLSTSDGAPVIDTSLAGAAAGTAATLYYDTLGGLAGMTADLHTNFYAKAASNPGFAGVLPTGDAFQLAVDQGLALGSGFYDANGVYVEPTDRTVNLWWFDRLHASKYGSYLSALVMFGSITGIDPWSFGASEQAAADLGISAHDAVKLQQVASEQLSRSGVALTRVPCLHANPRAANASKTCP